MPVQQNRFADDGGIAGETFFPKAVAENDDVGVTGLAVFGSEARADDGIDSEQGEETRGDVLNDDFLGLAITGEIVAFVENKSHAGENGIATLPIEKVGRRNGVMRVAMLGVAFPDHDQVVRIVIGERVKEDGIDDGENRGVGADAKAESEDSDDGEAGVAKQHAECVTKIACGFLQPADDVYFASVFLEEGGIAEAFLRFLARLLGGHSGGEVVCGAHF